MQLRGGSACHPQSLLHLTTLHPCLFYLNLQVFCSNSKIREGNTFLCNSDNMLSIFMGYFI